MMPPTRAVTKRKKESEAAATDAGLSIPQKKRRRSTVPGSKYEDTVRVQVPTSSNNVPRVREPAGDIWEFNVDENEKDQENAVMPKRKGSRQRQTKKGKGKRPEGRDEVVSSTAPDTDRAAAQRAETVVDDSSAGAPALQKKSTKRRKRYSEISVNLQQINDLLQHKTRPEAGEDEEEEEAEAPQQDASPAVAGTTSADNSHFWDSHAWTRAVRLLEELGDAKEMIVDRQLKLQEAIQTVSQLQKEFVRDRRVFKRKLKDTMEAIGADELDYGKREELQDSIREQLIDLDERVNESIDTAEKLNRRIFHGLGKTKSWVKECLPEERDEGEEEDEASQHNETQTHDYLQMVQRRNRQPQRHQGSISSSKPSKAVLVEATEEEVQRNRQQTNNYFASLALKCLDEERRLRSQELRPAEPRGSSIRPSTPRRAVIVSEERSHHDLQRWELDAPTGGVELDESPQRVSQNFPTQPLPAGYGHGKNLPVTPTHPRRRLGDGLYSSPHTLYY